MPSDPQVRQPLQSTLDWFAREAFADTLQSAQRDCVPELTRVFGHQGLYLRCSSTQAAQLPGNMLHKMTQLSLTTQGWQGDFASEIDVLPVQSDTFALVYASFVAECLSQPLPLLHELYRVIRPEGTMLLLQLNATAAQRLRWGLTSAHFYSKTKLQQLLQEADFQVQRVHAIGPVWSARGTERYQSKKSVLDGVRMARLWVAKRRDASMTPIRATPRVQTRAVGAGR
jgi:SAM-dependent methyltransferase